MSKPLAAYFPGDRSNGREPAAGAELQVAELPAARPEQRGEPMPRIARPAPSEAHLRAGNLHKSYRKGNIAVPVLRGLDLAIDHGEFAAIVGQSGSGKSTLLHLLGTLDGPDEGEVRFHGDRIDNLPAAGRDVLRNRYFGMVFQFYHLLPELNTLENVLVPRMIADGYLRYLRRRGHYAREAKQWLERVGLGHRIKHKPRELSGGEMQRTAIVRALISRPEILLADEPTGNLDPGTGAEIVDLLKQLNREENLTVIMVTHDAGIAAHADRIIRLQDGRIAPQPRPLDVPSA